MKIMIDLEMSLVLGRMLLRVFLKRYGGGLVIMIVIDGGDTGGKMWV